MGKDLIRSLLVKDPKKRLTADELLEHPWVKGTSTPRVQLPNVTQQIKEFNARRRLKVISDLFISIESCLFNHGCQQV